MTMKQTKVALMRDPAVPIGQTSPLYLGCRCGARPARPNDGEVVTCQCGKVYDRDGWVIKS